LRGIGEVYLHFKSFKVQNDPLQDCKENLQVLTETDLPPPTGKGTLDVRLARDREYFLA
jgi:hypothetical protein|tara:strand:+ start:1829 stop:2005 length:177 start_codon:yes stop_codon:yes gene_type:complete